MTGQCSDPRCPTHGGLTIRGTVARARVVSAKERKSAVVEIPRVHKVRKYERYEKRRSRIHVHVPECISVKEGDAVEIGECRKLSKTKAHVVIKKL
ncbi:MAG: 30S ribosomal protein S17 [Candidatus Micrarchaeota archaeon]